MLLDLIRYKLMFSIFLLLPCAIALPVALASRGLNKPHIYTISPDQWSDLNATVGGRLHRNYAKDCCDPIEFASGHGEQHGVGVYISWAYRQYQQNHLGFCNSVDIGCMPGYDEIVVPAAARRLSPISPFFVDAQSARDVQAAFAFATSNSIAISVEPASSWSSPANTLSIRTHALKSPLRFEDSFVPQSCARSEGEAITFSAGTTNDQLYRFAHENDRTVVAGFVPDETVSEWLATGGHGPLTNSFGLGVDNVLQIKAVLPDGSLVTANECENRELWFALRGGGANNFGIIVEATISALPKMPLEVAYLRFLSSDPQAVEKFTELCIEHADDWAKLGWGGYIVPGLMSQVASGYIMANPKLDHHHAALSMQKLTNFGLAHPQMAIDNSVKTVPSFYQLYTDYIVPNIATTLPRTDRAIGSRLVSSAQFASVETRKQLAASLTEAAASVEFPDDMVNAMIAPNSSPLTIFLTPPASYELEADTSSITPAWRDASWLVSVASVIPTDPLPSEFLRANLYAGTATDILRKNLPLSWGAALSEAHTSEPTQKAFWGHENAERLGEIKWLVDQGNLLRCESKTCVRPKNPAGTAVHWVENEL